MISGIVPSTSMPSRIWPADKGASQPMSHFTITVCDKAHPAFHRHCGRLLIYRFSLHSTPGHFADSVL